MSVFEAETKQQENQQETQETQTQESWIAKLVKERGEKWSDPEVIAKGKYEADRYISDLERQLEELRGDLSKQDYAKTLLETLQGKAGGTGTPKPEDKNTSTAGQNTTDEASNLESLVEEAIKKREAQQTVEQNLRQVDETMEQAYGTEAKKVVLDKAKELGVSIERLREIASESPSAFMKLIGGETKTTVKVPTSSVNTASNAFNSSTERDFGYYQELRRKNPNQYYSPKIQRQLLEDRNRLGDRFYQK